MMTHVAIGIDILEGDSHTKLLQMAKTVAQTQHNIQWKRLSARLDGRKDPSDRSNLGNSRCIRCAYLNAFV